MTLFILQYFSKRFIQNLFVLFFSLFFHAEETKLCKIVEIFEGPCSTEERLSCSEEIAAKYGPSIKVYNCKCDLIYTEHACICQYHCPPPPAPAFKPFYLPKI